jgi:hypothetical protein
MNDRDNFWICEVNIFTMILIIFIALYVDFYRIVII